MLSDEDKQDFIQSGKLASKIREESKKLIMIDQSLFDIAETIEQIIIEEGAKCAFPLNISINEHAAHFTPQTDCKQVLNEKDVVKIDLGVLLNGAIADTAYTIDLSGKYEKLVEASECALKNALKRMVPGTSIGEVSLEIEKTIKSFGFLPVSNLTGHMIKKNVLHAGIEIPNVRTDIPYIFEEGDVFALEPFASTGSGFVQDSEQVEIFSLINPKPLRMPTARNIQEHIIQEYTFLPFAQRWLDKKYSRLMVKSTLTEMIAQRILITYPVLKDSENGIISQAEHTVIVGDQPLVITE